MSLPHALLGLLAIEPRSGYELTKEFESYLGRYAWQAGHTSIYPELSKLAERDLVRITHEGARGSRTYDVTAEGREELRRWLLQPTSAPAKMRNELVLRMFLLNALDRDDALDVLRGIRDEAAQGIAELDPLRRPPHTALPAKSKKGFGMFAVEFGVRQYEAIHGWAEWAIEQLGREQHAP